MPELPILTINEIGEYIRHDCCERRFKLSYNGRAEARRLPFHNRLFNAIDPVLQKKGGDAELAWAQMLVDGAGYRQLTLGSEITWDALHVELSRLRPGDKVFAREVKIEGQLGGWSLKGRIDFIILSWEGEIPLLSVIECKSSRRDRTYHRIQVAAYTLLLKNLLSSNPLEISGSVVSAEQLISKVARIDESTNTPQSILALPPLDLEMESADIEELLAVDGPLFRISESQLCNLQYQLNYKCDGCVFNTDCFPESARLNKLELLGLSPANVRALSHAGVNSITDLAALDIGGEKATTLRRDSNFSESLPALIAKAGARQKTLPGGGGGFDVVSIPHSGRGVLPEYHMGGRSLVRIYLSVDYDYSENRIGALSAHVTTSENQLHTPYHDTAEGRRPAPVIGEVVPQTDLASLSLEDLLPVSGVEIVKYKSSPWTGDYLQDTGAERELLEGFLNDLVDAIDQVSTTDEAPIHFYVWSPGEMRRLVESCTRAGSDLLRHLRHLLGCRESLEQLIYSSVGQEVDRRFALAWTGRGLSVVTSLSWFGRRYHWTRQIGRTSVALDKAFTQDIFDFKTTLRLREDGEWGAPEDTTIPRHLFEIRSRFFDSLSAPYWRAVWGSGLPTPEEVTDRRLANMLERYRRVRFPNFLKEYLRARTHAIRWVEERISKNGDIAKPTLRIPDLRAFLLTRTTVADAAIDFLRLDQHVKCAEWVAKHLAAPADRVSSFMSLPIRDLRSNSAGKIVASLDYEGYGLDPATAATNTSFEPGSFVRVTPRPDGPDRGQSVGLLFRLGYTCILDSLDWDTGSVELSVMRLAAADRYRLQSNSCGRDQALFTHGLIEESPSDFIAPRVDDRLGRRSHTYSWFDPTNPVIPDLEPIPQSLQDQARAFLTTLRLPPHNSTLFQDQVEAIIQGGSSRVQLLQGPPGTGKTQTSAVAVLLRVALRNDIGDTVLISGPTHLAVNTLLKRIVLIQPAFTQHAISHGIPLPRIRIIKVHTSNIDPSDPGIQDAVADRVTPFSTGRRDSVLLVGGLTSAMMKLGRTLANAATFPTEPDMSFATSLFVDEASMMVFPNFLALSTLVKINGEIIVTGDHRQLAPIVAHDWEQEDRPPTVLYQPFVSAYEAIRRLGEHRNVTASQVALTSLAYSFRLPPQIRQLIGRIYAADRIELTGPDRGPSPAIEAGLNPFQLIWRRPTGLYLVVHDERESRRSNFFEANLIRLLLEAGVTLPDDSVAIITPHRAQRALLKTELRSFSDKIAMIDTVERLQGGECSNVIVSGTASDPSAISANVDFLLKLNRANVAFSRAQDRLIVFCSQSILNHIPAEVERYESAILWKSLRQLCSHGLGSTTIGDNLVRVFMYQDT